MKNKVMTLAMFAMVLLMISATRAGLGSKSFEEFWVRFALELFIELLRVLAEYLKKRFGK